MVLDGLKKSGVDVKRIVIPTDDMDDSGESSGERHKTMTVFMQCADQIIESGLTKHSCIISLGGGVVNNICGFLASSIYRGISLVHISTTMMAQSDAAIDFKQAVNHPCGKNLLGAYYPASVVVCDPCTLETLSSRHLLNGLSECLKHAFCQSRDFLDFMVDKIDQLRETDYLEEVIRHAVSMKAPTLTNYHKSDFNEMCPQYGHAIGHAIEHLSWETKSPLLHGEACAIGMCVSAEISHILGYCDEEVVEEHYFVFEEVGLPACVPEEVSISDIMEKMLYDKHYVAKKPTMGLLHGIGKMVEKSNSFAIAIDSDTTRTALELNKERTKKQ